MSDQSTYDVFISYSDVDCDWVEGYLLDALTHAGVHYHQEAAFTLGVPRLLEFERAVKQSQRTLLVLTPAYQAEHLNKFVEVLAQSYGLDTTTWRVIPLKLQPVELPPRLAMLTALDATDPEAWPAAIERLCETLQRPVPGPTPKPPCPYPGMEPFSEDDSERFFGRDEQADELLRRLRKHPFLTVIGPSGSGKSSLVFAGLIPAMRQSGLFDLGKWFVCDMRPGEAPMDKLASILRGSDLSDPAQAVSDVLAAQPEARRMLLVVDQFEEVFTQALDEQVKPFQQALRELALAPDCWVVLTVRADFYADLMASPLWPEIKAHRAEVLPLDENGLREAIVRPAEAEDVNVFLDKGLVERLIGDAAEEPGILPFVQETLVLLWEKIERRYLPLSAYNELSARHYEQPKDVRVTGLQVAMAEHAEAVLEDLTPEQQTIARRIFLRLVQFGEGRSDTRRQQSVSDLRAAGEDPGLFDKTLYHLADSRLLTLSGEEGDPDRQADLAHEALIEGWPTLQEWLAEGREAEQTRRRLAAAAANWDQLGRKGGLLDTLFLNENVQTEQVSIQFEAISCN
jgi:energy-coupling factor transporter ATP-binding protein EcfA2